MRIALIIALCLPVFLSTAQINSHVGDPIPNEPHAYFLVDSNLMEAFRDQLQEENAVELPFSFSIYQNDLSAIALRDSIASYSLKKGLRPTRTHFIHVSEAPSRTKYSAGFFASQSNWIFKNTALEDGKTNTPISLQEEVQKWLQEITPRLIHIAEPHYLQPHIFIQTTMADYKAMRKELERVALEEDLCSFTVIPSAISLSARCDSINDMLNGDAHISKQHTHYLDVGSTLQDAPFTTDFFASLSVASFNNDANTFFVEGKLMTLEELLVGWNSSYTWTYAVDQIERYHFKDVISSKRDKFLKFGIGVTNFIGEKDTNSVDNAFMSYQLTSSFQLAKRLRFSPFLNLGINTPKPQQAIQNEVSSQIDIQSIIDGTNTEDEEEIELDLTFNGHVYINAGFTADYTFKTNSFLQPYVGAGISIVSYNALQIEIDTTITIDLSELSPGSGGGLGDFDEGDRDPSAAGEGLTSYGGLATTFLLGAEAKIGKRWNAYIEGRYQPTISYLSGESNYGQSFSVQLGLAFRLNKRDHRVYEYARMR